MIKAICPGAGCRVIVPKGTRCERHQKQQYRVPEKQRETFRERGYTTAWTNLSKQYRKQHPLCVMCLSRGQVKPATCVDHIIPLTCCPSLLLDQDNLQSVCYRCNRYKALHDPKEAWEPNNKRIVLCGLPGTGKTTWAKSTGLPYFDADEYCGLTTIDEIQQARTKWIANRELDEPFIVIVASTITAPHVAHELRGVVKHMATQHVTRPNKGRAIVLKSA